MKLAPLGNVRFITVHCSGSPAGRGDTASDVRSWDMERFKQPAYHYVIDESGKVSQHLTLSEKGAHVGGHNTGNVGICYIGGLRGKIPADTRTPAQRLALRKLIDALKLDYPGVIVRGHRDWPGVAKACPCFDVASQL